MHTHKIELHPPLLRILKFKKKPASAEFKI
jgi:hypothetical protein